MIVLNYDLYLKHQVFSKINEDKSEIDSQNDPNNLLREEVKRDVSRCISRILALYPFFGEYLIECRFLYDHPEIDTMATDGKNIFINCQFASKLTDDQMIFILCHEVLHIMLLHHIRMINKLGSHPNAGEAKRWNYAADYELNPMLVKDGLLSEDEVKNKIHACYDSKYFDKAAEVIYDELGSAGDKGQEPPPGAQEWPVNIGDVIYTKDKKYGQITRIGADGTYDAKDLTDDEAKEILTKKK